MNLKLIQWLIAHREVLTAVVAAAKKFDRSAPYIDQWEVVNQIARIVIPVIQQERTDVSALCEVEFDAEVGAFALGTEVQALGVDWQAMIQLLLPVLIAILKLLQPDDE